MEMISGHEIDNRLDRIRMISQLLLVELAFFDLPSVDIGHNWVLLPYVLPRDLCHSSFRCNHSIRSAQVAHVLSSVRL